MKKGNRLNIILFAILSVVLLSSILQEHFGIIKWRKLQGVVTDQPMPRLSFTNYRSGDFQRETEQHLKLHFGFREPLIRFYNQYLWDFYDKTPVGKGQIVFGKNGWIYEPWFVEDYYQSQMHYYAQDSTEMAKLFGDEARRLYQLQHILESYGTHLFVCLLPGKDLVYSEYLPENTQYHLEKKISTRSFYENEFNRLGINHINVEQWFMQMKDTADFMLFPSTGTHWTNLASVYVADSLIRYMEQLGDFNMVNLCIGEKYPDNTREPDADLESLMNLIRPLPKPKYLYANVKTDADTSAFKPRIITIGDSFWWNIVNQLPMRDIFSSFPYWYYNSTIYFDEVHNNTSQLDLVDELLSANFVVLSYCSVQQYKMSNGFSKNALIALCYDKEEIDSCRASIKRSIESDESWMDKLRNKSVNDGVSIEQVEEAEITYLVNNNMEKYFPVLKDSIPTKRSAAVEAFFASDSLQFIEKQIQKVVIEIKSSPEKMEMMYQKSAEKGIDLETTIQNDAHWVVDYKIANGLISIPKQWLNTK